ncbi:hypothetical protein ACFVXQ_01045 [Kitasatospora sp. NPDC058263]
MMGSQSHSPVGEEEEDALTADAFAHAAQSRRNVAPRLVAIPSPEPKKRPEPAPETPEAESGETAADRESAPTAVPAAPSVAVDDDLVDPDSVYVIEAVAPTYRQASAATTTAAPVVYGPVVPGPVRPAVVSPFPLPVRQPRPQPADLHPAPAEPPAPAAVPPAAGGPFAAAPLGALGGPLPEPGYGFPAPAGVPAETPSAPAPESESVSDRPEPGAVSARWGWRGRVRQLSGGLISPAAGADEVAYREEVALVQRTLPGPRTVVFINPKGGASTTTSTLMASRTFGVHRAGGVLAWDNNETRGTLGGRAMRAGHANTARELLANITQFEDPQRARVGDLGQYLRGQGGHFDVLASDDRPEVTGHIAADDVARLHRLFSRYYRLIMIDTGNNMRAANWMRAVQAADLLVVTTTVRIDAANSALWMLDALERHVFGAGQLRQRTVTVLTEPSSARDHKLRAAMESLFAARTRAVANIPFDPALVDGGEIDHAKISDRTHRAWLHACAEMSRAL